MGDLLANFGEQVVPAFHKPIIPNSVFNPIREIPPHVQPSMKLPGVHRLHRLAAPLARDHGRQGGGFGLAFGASRSRSSASKALNAAM